MTYCPRNVPVLKRTHLYLDALDNLTMRGEVPPYRVESLRFMG